MEETTETLLAQILIVKWLLIFVIALLSAIVLGVIYIVVKASRVKTRLTGFKDLYATATDLADAKDLLERGRPDEVIEKCKSRLETHPKDRYAYWYLGRAYEDKKEYSKALEIFNTLLDIEPAWREEHLEPHIRDIKRKLENPDLRIL